MKFLVPNYSCLQNPWLGGYRPPDPRSLCPQLNLSNPPPPPEKNSWVRHCLWYTLIKRIKCRRYQRNAANEMTPHGWKINVFRVGIWIKNWNRIEVLPPAALTQQLWKMAPQVEKLSVWSAITNRSLWLECKDHFLQSFLENRQRKCPPEWYKFFSDIGCNSYDQ